jgi:hypothetical protein
MPNTTAAIKAMKTHVAILKRGKENLERLLKQQEKWLVSAEQTLEKLERDNTGN